MFTALFILLAANIQKQTPLQKKIIEIRNVDVLELKKTTFRQRRQMHLFIISGN